MRSKMTLPIFDYYDDSLDLSMVLDVELLRMGEELLKFCMKENTNEVIINNQATKAKLAIVVDLKHLSKMIELLRKKKA